MKVSEYPQGDGVAVATLTGKDLDYWVARAQGWDCDEYGNWYEDYVGGAEIVYDYTPSTNWQQCGELIIRFRVYLDHLISGKWRAQSLLKLGTNSAKGSTPQEAICRAVVASVYGDTVGEDGNG